jgi:hypothetical protein
MLTSTGMTFQRQAYSLAEAFYSDRVPIIRPLAIHSKSRLPGVPRARRTAFELPPVCSVALPVIALSSTPIRFGVGASASRVGKFDPAPRLDHW